MIKQLKFGDIIAIAIVRGNENCQITLNFTNIMKVLVKKSYFMSFTNIFQTFQVTGVLITLVCLENPPVMSALLRMNVLVPYSVIQQVIYAPATLRKNFKEFISYLLNLHLKCINLFKSIL